MRMVTVPQVIEQLVSDDHGTKTTFSSPTASQRASLASPSRTSMAHHHVSVSSATSFGLTLPAGTLSHRPSKTNIATHRRITLMRQNTLNYDVTKSALYVPDAQRKLFEACQNGDIDRVYEAMWNNVDPNCTLPVLGTTPLGVACRQGHKAIASLLLEFGAMATLADSYGVTPLHWAANSGNSALIHLLVTKGHVSSPSELAKRDFFGSTPLHFASVLNNAETVKTLIDCGCDPLIVNNDGRKASDLTTEESIKTVLVGKKSSTCHFDVSVSTQHVDLDEETRLLKAIAQGIKQPLRKLIIPGDEQKAVKSKKRRGSKNPTGASMEGINSSSGQSQLLNLKKSQQSLDASLSSSKLNLDKGRKKSLPKVFVSASASNTSMSRSKAKVNVK